MKKIWVAISNESKEKVIAMESSFKRADRLGQKYCVKHDTTFYLREYVEFDSNVLDYVNLILRDLKYVKKKIEGRK